MPKPQDIGPNQRVPLPPIGARRQPNHPASPLLRDRDESDAANSTAIGASPLLRGRAQHSDASDPTAIGSDDAVTVSLYGDERSEDDRRGRETNSDKIISGNLGDGKGGSRARAGDDGDGHGDHRQGIQEMGYERGCHTGAGVNTYGDPDNDDDDDDDDDGGGGGGDDHHHGDSDGDHADGVTARADGHESNDRRALHRESLLLPSNASGLLASVDGFEASLSRHESSVEFVSSSNGTQCELGHTVAGSGRSLDIDGRHGVDPPHRNANNDGPCVSTGHTGSSAKLDMDIAVDIAVVPTHSRPCTQHGCHEDEGVIAVMLPSACGGGRVTRAYGPQDTIFQFMTSLRQDLGVDVVPEGALLFTTSPRRELSNVSLTFEEAGVVSRTVLHLDMA